MVSLWGKQDDDDERDNTPHNGESSNDRVGRGHADDADERTRLLPPPGHDGYLSPDDPAVSLDPQHLAIVLMID